jgi:hypothetical protein
MQVVSSTESATRQQKARLQRVFVRDNDYTVNEPTVREQKILQPDDKLRNAIPIDVVRDNIVEYIRKKHANS